MESLVDLKKFVWTKDHKWFIILAITDFEEHDVVVYRETTDGRGGYVGVETVDNFCRNFTATYQVRQ